ncbi:hypothetical protein [Burkholderia sp. WAC0059]|uniref:hypothetical protein n=1 Tax=Burkholderia sp. WAC0059 TaxID=2066022 RepID=UPI0015E0B7E8|nr:hypothetical protein [Burkholderia sp. WAC0059]
MSPTIARNRLPAVAMLHKHRLAQQTALERIISTRHHFGDTGTTPLTIFHSTIRAILHGRAKIPHHDGHPV